MQAASHTQTELIDLELLGALILDFYRSFPSRRYGNPEEVFYRWLSALTHFSEETVRKAFADLDATEDYLPRLSAVVKACEQIEAAGTSTIGSPGSDLSGPEDDLQKQVMKVVGPEAYASWFSKSELSLKDDTLVVMARSDFATSYIEKNYGIRISSALSAMMARQVKMRVVAAK